jgi:hypothetical protein
MTRKKIEAVLAAKLEAERAGAQGGGDVAGAVRELASAIHRPTWPGIRDHLKHSLFI